METQYLLWKTEVLVNMSYNYTKQCHQFARIQLPE